MSETKYFFKDPVCKYFVEPVDDLEPLVEPVI